VSRPQNDMLPSTANGNKKLPPALSGEGIAHADPRTGRLASPYGVSPNSKEKHAVPAGNRQQRCSSSLKVRSRLVGAQGIRSRTLPPGREGHLTRFAILWNRMRTKGVLPVLPNVPAYCKVPVKPYQDLLSKSSISFRPSASPVRGVFSGRWPTAESQKPKNGLESVDSGSPRGSK
jgi:hypothetical protein